MEGMKFQVPLSEALRSSTSPSWKAYKIVPCFMSAAQGVAKLLHYHFKGIASDLM